MTDPAPNQDPSDGATSFERRATRSTPRWVKAFAIVALAVGALGAVVLVTGAGGEHGPGRHMPSATSLPDASAEPAPSTAPGGHRPPPGGHGTSGAVGAPDDAEDLISEDERMSFAIRNAID